MRISLVRNIVLFALVCGSAVLMQCSSPLDIDTPRRVTSANIDSLITTETFIGRSSDSLFALVDGEELAFATEISRPSFYNGRVDGAYYITIQAITYGIDGGNYDIVSLRLDGIRDTGTYPINGIYSAPKGIDPTKAPRFAAQYEQRRDGGLRQTYRTGLDKSTGEIRVVLIDEVRKVMVGTFWFGAYDISRDSVKIVERGAFRVQLPE